MKKDIITARGMLFSISLLVRSNGNIFLSPGLLYVFVIKILGYGPQSRCTRLAELAYEAHMPRIQTGEGFNLVRIMVP